MGGERDVSDEDAYTYYLDPEHRRLQGRPRRRSAEPVLTEHVPVRFRPEVVARVRSLAERDGVTISSWIRQAVEEAVERRMPSIPITGVLGTASGEIRHSSPQTPRHSTELAEWDLLPIDA